MTWLFGIPVLAIVVYVAARLIIGATYPVNLLAKQLLRKRLQELDVDPSSFSDRCLDELCEYAISTLHGSVRQQLPENINGIAVNVAWICFGSPEATPAEIIAQIQSGLTPVFWEILAKHDPERFSLDQLEKTQHANQVLLAEKK